MFLSIKKAIKDLVRSKAIGWTLARILLMMVVLGVASFMLFENKLVYFPHRHKVGDGDMTPPPPFLLTATRVAHVEALTFTPADDPELTLHAWYYSLHEDDDAVKNDYVVIYCHGNAGDVPRRHQKSALICSVGLDVLAFDYRGYGASDGSPDESGLYADGRAAYDYLIARGFEPDHIIIYGESLGGGVAVDLATKVPCAGLITESTFTSIPDMAAVAYPFVPRFIIRTQFNSLKKIPSVTCPKFFMHGSVDGIVPKTMCDRLFAAATEPKRQRIFPKADHDDVFAQDDYAEVWAEFVEFVMSSDARGHAE